MPQEPTWEPTLAALFDCCQVFHMQLAPDELADRILKAVAQLSQSSRASLMLLDEERELLIIKVAVGLPREVAAAEVRLGEGIAGWVAQNKRPLLLPDGPDVPASVREAMVREEITCALCVPLEVEGRPLGVLNLARQGDAAPFTLRDLCFVSLVADRVAMALHSLRLHSRLENQERFSTPILESIPSSLVVIDRALRIVSVNRNFLQKTRREARATLRCKIEEVFPQVLLEYTELDQKVREVFRTGQLVEGGRLAYRAPGLPTRIYYYRLIPLKAEEAVENVMLLMDDITEREQLGEEVRRAERHLASVVECANDLVVSMDAKGEILTWNKAAEAASGFELEEVKGQYLPNLCAEGDQQEMRSWLVELAKGRFAKKSLEINLGTKEGEEVPISWAGSRMLDDERRIVGLVAVGRDLTERKRLEAQLITSAKLTSLGVMAGGIAHEIRNPLAISSAAAQLLLESHDDDKLRKEAAEKIYSGIQRASYIIENLLKFARPPEQRMVATDISEVLEETVSLLANQLRVQQIELRKDFALDLPPVVGNKGLLQQVFSNMILNACNAMPDGGSLAITTRVNSDNQVEIEFGDTGCGIPREHLSKIFDPFFTTMPVGMGLGLGLSISYSIIQQHQGTIEVESQMGQGTTFTVRLPVDSR